MSSFFPPLVWIVGFTGHRPKEASPGRSEKELEALRPVLAAQLALLKAKACERGGSLELATSVAAGADVLIAEVARELKVPIHLFLPLSEEAFADDFKEWPAWWPRAKELIRHAKEGEDGATLRVTEGATVRPECYYDCGVQIVEAADAMLFVWDGDKPSGIGGTGDLIARARSERLPFARESGGDDGFVWLPIPVGIVRTPSGAAEWENLENFASKGDAGASWCADLRLAAAKHSPRQSASGDAPRELLGVLGTAADRASQMTRHTVKLAITAHGAASLIAATTAVFFAGTQPDHGTWVTPVKVGLSTTELALVCLAWVIIFRLRRRHAQAHWLRLRPATELVRSLKTTARLLDPLFPMIMRHLPGWRRLSISAALALRAKHGPLPLDECKAAYLRDRIQDQAGYYKSKLAAAAPVHHLAQAVSRWCSLLAIPFVAYALVGKIFHFSDLARNTPWQVWHEFAASWLPIALPLLAGIATAYQGALDTGRRVASYREMIERLDGFRRTIETIRTETALRRIVSQVEEVLIDEQVEWRTATRSAGH